MTKSSTQAGEHDDVLTALTSATSSKLRLFATLTGLIGLAITLAAEPSATALKDHVEPLSFLGRGSFEAVGGALLSSAVILVAFEQYVRRQSQAIERARAEELLAKYEDRLMSRLPSLLSVGDETTFDALARATNPQQLRGLGIKSLGAALGNREAAEVAVAQLEDRLRVSSETWRGLRIHMTIRPTTDSRDTDNSYFDVNISASFTCDSLTQVSAVCTTNAAASPDLISSGKYVWVWYHEPTRQFPEADRSVFEFSECMINGKSLEIGHSKTDGEAFFQTLDPLVAMDGGQVTVKLRARVQRRGHCVYFTVPRICDSVRYDLDYSGCGIQFVSVHDAFGAPRRAAVERLVGASDRVVVDMSGWVYPQSGVVFVWVLKGEMKPQFSRMIAVSERRDVGGSRG